MSVTQTYYLAHTARGKLSSEAARADHNLRLLVGHANLLDSLMLELAAAEQEQESWFNQSVSKATKTEEPKHIQWADTIVEDPEEDWQAEDADSDSDSEYDEDEDVEMGRGVSSRPVAHAVAAGSAEDEEESEDDEEFGFELQLTRSHSNKHSPPELDLDSDDSSSEDESMPPSPPSDTMPSLSEKQRQAIATTGYYAKSQSSIPPSKQQAFFDQGYYLPQRTQPGLIGAISVY
jgi:hypothetical protein